MKQFVGAHGVRPTLSFWLRKLGAHRAPLLLISLLLFCCAKTDQVVVVSKNFGESVLLGELLAQHIEKQTAIGVKRKLHLGGTFICHEALKSGEADLYVEYTGTALTAILKKEPKTDRHVVYSEVKKAYENQFDMEWTEPLGFNNTFAIIIRDEDAKRLGIQTISEASQYTPQWKAGFGYEFMERKDGFPGLAAMYGLQFSQPPRVMDLTLTYRAIAEKQVDFIAGNSTDGIISKLNLFVLEDDKQYFPPYDAAPVVRGEILRRYPQIRAALKQLAGKISETEMRKMNYQVDGEHRDVKVVAADFLKSLEVHDAGGSN